jgi:hypothetical protein
MKLFIKSLLRETLLTEKMVLKDYSTYIRLIAEAYQKAPNYDSSVVKHWNSLNASNHILFKRLLSKVNVVFTTNDASKVGQINIDGRDFKIIFIKPEDEYQTQSQMKQEYNQTKVLKISIDYSEHPVFSVEDNIVFRTVHDYIAHIQGDHDFGPKGELACYNLHAKMASKDAIPALFTEVVGQASTTIVTGDFPIQKIALLKGFDYFNVGKVEDQDYEIKDKELIKKGETTSVAPKNRTTKEPTAIHKDIKTDITENDNPDYAVIEILIYMAYMPPKGYFQVVPFDKLSDNLISVKKGSAGSKMISTKNVRVLKTFMRGQEDEMGTYLNNIRNSQEN